MKKWFQNAGLIEPDQPGSESPPASEADPPIAARPVPRAIPYGASQAAPAYPPPVPAAAPIAPVQVDPEMVARLETATGKSTKPGYLQLQAQLGILSAHIPDERTRYAAALASVAATVNIPGDAVLASVEDRLRLLVGERERFEKAMAKEAERTIAGPMAEAQTISDTIAAKQLEIAALEAEREAKLAAVGEAQAHIDEMRASFAVAFATVEAPLQQELARIQPHVAATTPTAR